MTLSLKQRAKEIYSGVKNWGPNEVPIYRRSTLEEIEQALQEVRGETIREAAKEFMCADVAFWTPAEARKIILALLPPPKTGKP